MIKVHLGTTRLEIILLAMLTIVVVGQMYVVIPLFAPMGSTMGHPAAEMVIVSSAFGFPYACAGLIAGPLADAWGAKKVVILSLSATALTTLAVAFAPGLMELVSLRAFQGLTAGFLSAPVFAYIARDLEEDARVFATTAVMAAAMSSAVLMQLFAQVAEGLCGWRTVFFLAAPAIVLMAYAAHRLLAESSATRENRLQQALMMLPGLLLRGRLLALYAAALSLLSGFVAVLSGIALYGPAALRASPEHLFLLRASALPVMVAVPFLAVRLRGLSPALRIIAGLGLSAIALGAAASAAESPWALAAGLSFCVAGLLIAAPAIVQGAAQSAANASGAAVSLYTFAVFLGASLGPRLAVALAPTGLRGLLSAIAMLFAVSAILGAVGLRA
jgi:MFS family permease